MVSLVTQDQRAPRGGDREAHDPRDHRRRLRNRNIAVAAVLAALVVLFYVVAIVKMSGG